MLLTKCRRGKKNLETARSGQAPHGGTRRGPHPIFEYAPRLLPIIASVVTASVRRIPATAARAVSLQAEQVAARTPRHPKGSKSMGTITTKDGTEIFYKDWGHGQPLFFHHGWPLSADDWDSQMMFFLAH